MSSAIIQIAEDVAAKVNAIQFDETALVAVVDLAPDFDLAKIKERRIVVSPQSYVRTNIARGESGSSAKINVCVCEKITLLQIADRLDLVETIARGLERQQLAGAGALVTSVEFDPVYDANLLRSTHVFVSVCTVTVKVIR